MRNLYGHVDARLEGPQCSAPHRSRGRFKKGSYLEQYDEYSELYGEFITLARLFNKEDVPHTRLVIDEANGGVTIQEHMIHRFCESEAPDALEQQRKVYAQWLILDGVMDKLADCAYVHSVSKLTRIIQTYRDPQTGTILRDIDVTDTPYLVPASHILSVRAERHPHTKDEYKKRLMAVIQTQ